MPAIQTIATPRRNRISVDIPVEYRSYSFQVILVPLEEVRKPKYDFSDLVGKLEWNGDAVQEQRKMRDEW